eukprot:gene20997-21749_t
MDPPLVLADEPTGNLDTVSAEGVFELMRRINAERKTTFLLVTHSQSRARRRDRIVSARSSVDCRLKCGGELSAVRRDSWGGLADFPRS